MAVKNVNVDMLREWLTSHKPVTVVDVRPASQRAEWSIPGSIHIDAYDRLKAGDQDALLGLDLDRSQPVVTVCAAGKTSQVAAQLLQQSGFDAYSLDGGMQAWSRAWNSATVNFDNFQVMQLRRTGKGCLSYIIASEGKALVIDASLPIEVYSDLLKEQGWHLEAVIDTHIHADHLSRSSNLASSTGATLYLPAQSGVQYPFTSLSAGSNIELGGVNLDVIGAPGHTLGHVVLLVENKVLFSGDTLFTNSVGRPDLKADEDQTKHKAALLYDSLQSLLQLDENILVLPGHTSTPVNFDGVIIGATLAKIKEQVSLLHLPKEVFVETVAAKTPPTPPNYIAIVERNTTGTVDEKEAVELEAGANRCAI